MSKRVRDIFKTGQKGFTLIELVAVMAILAILVAVVAPAVTGTRDASVRAQAGADGKEVFNRATKYFGDQEGSEIITPHTVTVDSIAATSTPQFISSRWPEKFLTRNASITDTSAAIYSTEFDAGAGPDKVILVNLMDEDNVALTDKKAILKFTAINFDALGDGNGTLTAADKAPSTATQQSTVAGVTYTVGSITTTLQVHDFLWLFEKGTSGSGLDDDVRSVAVFILTGTEINEVVNPNTVNLTYKRIL